jgi:hypothetical protein
MMKPLRYGATVTKRRLILATLFNTVLAGGGALALAPESAHATTPMICMEDSKCDQGGGGCLEYFQSFCCPDYQPPYC